MKQALVVVFSVFFSFSKARQCFLTAEQNTNNANQQTEAKTNKPFVTYCLQTE